MNIRDLTPGTIVAIVHTATSHVAAMRGEYLGTYPGGVVLQYRGLSSNIPWNSEFYIADMDTLTAYTRDDDEVLTGEPPELE